MRSVNHLIEQFTDRKSNLRSVNHLIEPFADCISYVLRLQQNIYLKFLERSTRFERTTPRLEGRRAINCATVAS